ncbi:MAG: PQQ-binding-like beta-propeller repeat protein [Bacteroidales bacterium]|nr:PQQ-binding-like beta-propeller repeat protein [Bacteroidales bacterium]
MNKSVFILILFFALLNHNTIKAQKLLPERQWPSYRGYYANGILDNANLPDTWNVPENKNVKWKIDIPGMGLSSPVIWGDKLFITTAISKADTGAYKIGLYGSIESIPDESEHEWKLYCFDKNNGEKIWEKTSCKGIPMVKRHPKSSHANSTVATDGNYVVTFFGSEGLYCYDMAGNLQWDKKFGKLKSVFFAVPSAEWEFASCPIIHNGVVIIQCDVLENSFVAAYDEKTGKELWKKERDEYPGWCTPNIYKDGEKTRVVLNGYKHRGAYDFNTGEEIWRMSGGGDIQIPTPILGNNLIYFNSAHGKSSPILAVKTSAKGDLTLKEDQTTNEYIKWSIPRGGAYMQTMLLYGDYLYNVRWNGSITCYNAKSGEEIYKETLKMGMSFTACPIASDGKIYVVDDEGWVYIVKAGKEYKLLNTCPLGDIFMTTPAISDNALYFRTMKHLIAISKK